MANYSIGDILYSKYDPGVTATVADIKNLNGIVHYRMTFSPRGYATEPCWLSEYGVRIDFQTEPPRSAV